LNPGLPTPQAGILNQSRAEFPRIVGKGTSLSMLDDDPALQEYNSQILKTIEEMTAQQATEQEYISKAVQLGTPNTIKEIAELAEAGFTKFTEADGYQIFRKPK
jgi:hypothetical protein